MNRHRLKHGRRRERSSTSEMQEARRARITFADQLVEKWSRTRPGSRLQETWNKNPSRARNAAIALEMQEQYLRKLSEDTISSEFQTTPENVLRIVRIGTANSNRGEFFHEWPMTTTDDSIYFIEKTYGSTLRGATAGENIHETVRQEYATESDILSLGTGDGAQTVFASSLPIIPVVPHSIKIIVAGRLVGSDDGSGNITGTDITVGTVDYQTGAISVTFGTAPALGEEVESEYQWDSEVEALFPQIGDVNIRVTRKRFNARPHSLGYQYSRMVELTLGTSGLGNVDDMLVRAVGDEHAMRRDYKAVQLGKRLALGNPTTFFDADFAAAGEDNDYNHAQRVLSTISDMSGDVYNDLKRGTLNVGIAGQRALTYLKKHKLWKTDDSQPRVGGTFFAGELDKIRIFGTPSGSDGILDQDEVLLSFKNPDEDGDVSVAFGVLTELVAALDFPEFRRKGQIATVEDSLPINPKFLRLLKINNL